MKVDLVEDEFALMCVCECIGDDFDKTNLIVGREDNGYDIEFKVNEVELNFMEVLRLLHDNYDNQVELKAKEIIKDKYEKIVSQADRIIEDLDDVKLF